MLVAMGAIDRLSPTMRSRKLQALTFIKGYFAEWGHSPSLDELGAAIGVSKQHAHDILRQLANDQMIRRVAGKRRGIELIDRAEELGEGDVLLRLAKLGWRIRHDDKTVAAPAGDLTKIGLIDAPVLDHDPGIETGVGFDDEDKAG